ncbi:chemotaxis protein CheW [Aneurinibacillus terranovensis]|uniref:chemotaxis protein CheW n=1 Tax=Aneurinibacillus terranovensis TaxID=278991 RepID=UPI0003FB8A22|nr:chemotaxis protein CheW [Aneurinibacillus terranovensis]
MPRKSDRKKDQTNLEKMKNEMIRKKEKAEKASVAGQHDESTVILQGEVREGTQSSRLKEALLVRQVHASENEWSGEAVRDDAFDVQSCIREEDGQSNDINKPNIGVMTLTEGDFRNPENDEVLHNDEIDNLDLVVFWVGAEQFAFRLVNVKEIIKVDKIKRVPHAPANVAGLCSLRGSILPVVDIRRCLHMPEKEYNDDSRIIVADIHGRNVGIITDGISEVISIKASSILEPPANIKHNQSRNIIGIVLGDNGRSIIMVLDVENVVKFEQMEKDFLSDKTSDRDGSFSPASHHGDEAELVIFYINDEQYALDVRNVKEILRYVELLKVPNSPYYVEGVVSVRNNLLAVINLAKLFGAEHHGVYETTRIIVADAGDFSYGVIVDKVSEVARVPRKLFYKPFDIVKNAEKQFIREFANLSNGKQVVMILDPRKLASLNNLRAINFDHLTCGASGNVMINEEMPENQFLDQEQIVAFKVDNEEYGIRINYVCEVNRMDEIYSFPGAPDFIDGMVNLRGDIIPVLNLRAFFGKSLTNKSALSMLLVVEYKKQRIGLMIDSVTEVVRVNKDLLEETTRALEAENKKKFIHHIGKLNEGKRPILIIDLTAVLDFVIGQ